MTTELHTAGLLKYSMVRRLAWLKAICNFRPYAVATASVLLLLPTWASADPPETTVEYQPMVSTGLAAKHQFEAWFVFGKSLDPSVSGYAVPAGAKIRLTFPEEFTPSTAHPNLEGALLYGWPQGAIPIPFSVTQDADPRVVEVQIDH